jgi:uncharacterized RDD family membrane protein YckC
VENLDPGGTGMFHKPERTGRSAMTDQPSRAGLDVEVKPHAYDPIAHPELFEGVLTRRVLAFIVDVLIITIPIVLVSIFIFLFGIFTLGLGWLLFWLVSPASAIWAIVYYGFTMGSPASATYGMRAFDLEIRTWYGGPCYFLLGAVHAILFWISISALTPFIVLLGLFNERRRLLHDFLIGTVVINSDRRLTQMRGYGTR